MKTVGDTVEEIIKAGHYSTGTIIDKVAGYKVPLDCKPSLTNSLANTLAAACEKLDKSRARIEQLEAALREIADMAGSTGHDDSGEFLDAIEREARKALE